jgi:hypothetical protein
MSADDLRSAHFAGFSDFICLSVIADVRYNPRELLGAKVGHRGETTMMRTINRLNDRRVKTITKPGRHADGGNLYLSVSKPPSGGRRWVFLYRWHGKPTEIGFGSARDVTLARARELATEARAIGRRSQSQGRPEAERRRHVRRRFGPAD